ncbi:uncharacterized protein LOC121376558 [Gigantopelta aegis]|uniref:uncharacterized protein LOC121376558 n=1 Tax=Gigantopelta aegis TaxID=1735272 RepID=UPI001B88E0F7|nr:uncharacterized protein LOC121376558 [Gigantopelta aegis]
MTMQVKAGTENSTAGPGSIQPGASEKHVCWLSPDTNDGTNESVSFNSLLCEVGSDDRMVSDTLSEASLDTNNERKEQAMPMPSSSSSSSHSQIAYRERYFGKTPKKVSLRPREFPLRLNRSGRLGSGKDCAVKQDNVAISSSSSLSLVSSQSGQSCFTKRYLIRLGMERKTRMNRQNETSAPLSVRSLDGSAEKEISRSGLSNKSDDRKYRPTLPTLIDVGSAKVRTSKKYIGRKTPAKKHRENTPSSPLCRGDSTEILVEEDNDRRSEQSVENNDRKIEQTETKARSPYLNRVGFIPRPKCLFSSVDSNNGKKEMTKVTPLCPRLKQVRPSDGPKSKLKAEKSDIKGEKTKSLSPLVNETVTCSLSPRLTQEGPVDGTKSNISVENRSIKCPKHELSIENRSESQLSAENSKTVMSNLSIDESNRSSLSLQNISNDTKSYDSIIGEPKTVSSVSITNRSSERKRPRSLKRPKTAVGTSIENRSESGLSAEHSKISMSQSSMDESNRSFLFKSYESILGEPKTGSNVSITKKSSDEETPSSSKQPRTPAGTKTPNRIRFVETDVMDFYKALSKYMKDRGFFDKFPSPTLLSKAVEEYETVEINWPLDEEGVVCPCPPESLKREEVNVRRMIEMDKRALTIPDLFLKRPLFEVVQYLIELAENEVEMARVMFRWLTTQDLNREIFDDPAVFKLPEDYACVLLRKLKMGDAHYSDIYESMASYANIECVKLTGACKRYSKTPCQEVCRLNMWSWVSVYLEGDWRLVDCRMGAICWQETQKRIETNETKETTETKETKDDKPANENNALHPSSLAYFLNDFYFMTDPKDFILSHFPTREYWQLLPRPVKYTEFINMPFIEPAYLFFSIQAPGNERLCVVAERGEASFEFVFPEGVPVEFSYRLRKIEERKDSEASDNKHSKAASDKPEDYVFLDNDHTKNVVTVSIKPPENGQYVFEMFGKNNSDPKNTRLRHLCSYLVQNSYVDQTFEGFPQNELMEWGPGNAAEDIGMVPINHFEGIVNTVDGKAEIAFGLSKHLVFHQKLTERSPGSNSCDAYALNRTENGEVIFSVNPPKEGHYCLKIYAKEDNDKSQFQNVCNYLIRCSDILEEPTPYPKEACGRVGVKNACGHLGLTFVSPQSPVIYSPENGKISLRFLASRPVVLSPDLRYCDEKGNTEQLPDNVSQSRRLKNMIVRAKFPKHGLYYLSVSGRNEAYKHEDFVEVYNAVVHCNWPLRELVAEPKYLDAWKSNYVLHCPTQRYLQAESSVAFSLTVPGATGVVVTTDDATQHLQKKGNGLWESNIVTGRSRGNSVLEVSAFLGSRVKESKLHSSLLEFKVVSQPNLEDISESQKVDYDKAIQRIERLKSEGKWRDPPRQPDVFYDRDDTVPMITLESNVLLLSEGVDSDRSMDQTSVHSASTDPSINKDYHSPMLAMTTSDDDNYWSDYASPKHDVPSDGDQEFSQWAHVQEKKRSQEDDKELKDENYKVQVAVMRSRLKSNIQGKNKYGLKMAIADARKKNLAVDSPEYGQAMRTISVLSLRDEIMYYLHRKDIDRVKYLLSAVERRGFAADIPHEVAKAKASLQKRTSPPKARGTPIIDVPTLAEIGRYHNPPSIVHRVFVTVLLLMGVHQGITKKWKRCHKICVTLGSMGMNKRLADLKVKDVEPSIAARAREILEINEPEDADAVSPGIGALYGWAKGIVDDVMDACADADAVEPARTRLQKKILKNSKIVEDLSLEADPDEYVEKNKSNVAEKPPKTEWRT